MKHQENDVKETKKTRKKRSARTAQQIKLAVIMIMVSVLVLSASTFAWYQLNNTAKIENMKFTAETMGNLQISDSGENGENKGDYKNVLELSDDLTEKTLLPCTTDTGIKFYSPDYDLEGTTVGDVKDIDNNDLPKYVYKKVFYLKSGEAPTGGAVAKTFDLKLDPGKTDSPQSGTYFLANDAAKYNAVNAVRISFEFDDSNEEGQDTIKIYEPNAENHNSGDDITKATNSVSTEFYGPAKYMAIKQKSNGDFVTSSDSLLYNEHTETSNTLCQITEGTPMKVTMYVWFEGMDDDCVSQIALTQITGQIQFRAEEKKVVTP